MTRVMILDLCLRSLEDSDGMAPEEGVFHAEPDFAHLLFFRVPNQEVVGNGHHSFLRAHDSGHGQNGHCATHCWSGRVYSDCSDLFEYGDLL